MSVLKAVPDRGKTMQSTGVCSVSFSVFQPFCGGIKRQVKRKDRCCYVFAIFSSNRFVRWACFFSGVMLIDDAACYSSCLFPVLVKNCWFCNNLSDDFVSCIYREIYQSGSKIVQISNVQILMIFWQIKSCWGKMDIYKYISGKHEPKSEIYTNKLYVLFSYASCLCFVLFICTFFVAAVM